MTTLVWSKAFARTFKRLARTRPHLHARTIMTLGQLTADPFEASLRTHKLTGLLKNSWACTVDYDCRIIFEFVKNPRTGAQEILLLTMGTHDEVY